MNSDVDFFDLWLKTQKELISNWAEGAKQVQDIFSSTFAAGGDGDDGKKGHEDFNIYNWWLAASSNYLKDINNEDFKVIEETFRKFFSDSSIFMKLQDVWLPIMKGIQERTLQPEAYMEMLDPSNYKELLDKVFGFGSPEAMLEFYKQAANVLNMGRTSVMEFSKPWAEVSRKIFRTLPDQAEGHVGDSMMLNFHNMFNAFESTFGKALHMPAIWKDREKVELLLKGYDDLAAFMAKNTQYQYTMYSTGLKAMGKVIEAIALKIRDGEEIKSFNEFLDIWIAKNEETFNELLKTAEFARFQGEFMDTALTVRRHFFKLMELYLYDFPIALRSEMDELYKTVYELKKKVKSLERESKKQSLREVAA